jgi:putative oxidoreductase
MLAGLDEPTTCRVRLNERDHRAASTPMAELAILLEAKAMHSGRSARNHLALTQTYGVSRRRVDELIDRLGTTRLPPCSSALHCSAAAPHPTTHRHHPNTPEVRATGVARVSGRSDDPMEQTRKETAVITTGARVTAREARPRRSTSMLLWAGQILLAVLFVAAALPKLTGDPGMVHEFAQIGAGQWMRYLTGATELAGAIGLLTPWLAGLAAAGLAAEMAGATIINATVLHSSNVVLTVPLCTWSVLVAYRRRQQINGLPAAIRRCLTLTTLTATRAGRES